MEDLVVVGHHYDALTESYVLTIGFATTRQVQAVDAQGEPVYEPGETVKAETGEEVVLPGAPVMVDETIHVPVEDFAFTALDPKWEGLSEDAIVKEQRKMVRAALRKREKDAEDAAARLSPMPGVGDPL